MSFSRTHCIRVSSRSSRPRWVPPTRNSAFALTPAVTARAPTSGASRPPSLARALRRCRAGSPSRDPRMTADERGDARELSARVGETRRLTMMFCDVVGSTELSSRQDPETYRDLMGAYRGACRDVIESRFEGHIVQLKGDGALSSFGFPRAHENDTERAVLAGLALVRAVQELSTVTRATVGGARRGGARGSRWHPPRAGLRRPGRARHLRSRCQRSRQAPDHRRSGHSRR